MRGLKKAKGIGAAGVVFAKVRAREKELRETQGHALRDPLHTLPGTMGGFCCPVEQRSIVDSYESELTRSTTTSLGAHASVAIFLSELLP